jgi:hypothetical protein
MTKYAESHQLEEDQESSLLPDQVVAIYPQAVGGDVGYLFDSSFSSSTSSASASAFPASSATPFGGPHQITPAGIATGTGAMEQTNKPSYCLVWKDLSVLLKKNGNKLIDNVSGIARSGRVLALMGPSG